MEKCGALAPTYVRHTHGRRQQHLDNPNGAAAAHGYGMELCGALLTCVRYMGGGSGILTTSMVRPRASGVVTSTARASRLISYCGSRGSSVQDRMT